MINFNKFLTKYKIYIFFIILLFITIILNMNYFEYFNNNSCDGCEIPSDASGNCKYVNENESEKCCPTYCTNYNAPCVYDINCENNCPKWTKWNCDGVSCDRMDENIYTDASCNTTVQ